MAAVGADLRTQFDSFVFCVSAIPVRTYTLYEVFLPPTAAAFLKRGDFEISMSVRNKLPECVSLPPCVCEYTHTTWQYCSRPIVVHPNNRYVQQSMFSPRGKRLLGRLSRVCACVSTRVLLVATILTVALLVRCCLTIAQCAWFGLWCLTVVQCT